MQQQTLRLGVSPCLNSSLTYYACLLACLLGIVPCHHAKPIIIDWFAAAFLTQTVQLDDATVKFEIWYGFCLCDGCRISNVSQQAHTPFDPIVCLHTQPFFLLAYSLCAGIRLDKNGTVRWLPCITAVRRRPLWYTTLPIPIHLPVQRGG